MQRLFGHHVLTSSSLGPALCRLRPPAESRRAAAVPGLSANHNVQRRESHSELPLFSRNGMQTTYLNLNGLILTLKK